MPQARIIIFYEIFISTSVLDSVCFSSTRAGYLQDHFAQESARCLNDHQSRMDSGLS